MMINRVLEEMIVYFNGDLRRINHALKVYGFAVTISGLESVSEKEKEIIALTAVLHDIGIKEAERKYNSTAGKYQEIEGPPIAKQILENQGIDNPIVERVCFLIGHHHSYSKIDGLDFQIIVEADFLVNIFEDNLERDAIESVRKKYFKTKHGIKLLDSMYSRQ
jgi:hypothetical protein